MNSLQYPRTSENEYCPVSIFLKGLFAHCRQERNNANLVIRNNVAEIKGELARLQAPLSAELSPAHLAAAEESLPDVAFRYALLYKDEQPVMFVAYQVFTLTARNFNLDRERSFVKGILRLFLQLHKAKVMVLGNALRTDATAYCYDTDALTEQEAIKALATVTEQIASNECIAATVLPGMDGLRAQSAQAFTSIGYSMPWDDNVMQMDIDSNWTSLSDYVASLTRKYKTRANKVIGATAGLVQQQFSEADLVHYQADINRLFACVIDNQSFTLTSSGAAYITAQKKLYGDAFELNGFFDQGKLIAFYSAFVKENVYEVFYVGFDTALNNTMPLYFNLLLASLERAILLKKKELRLGRTSFDAKASLGAKPEQKNYFVKLRYLPDVAMKWLSAYFSSMEDTKWKLRNPLKAEAVPSGS